LGSELALKESTGDVVATELDEGQVSVLDGDGNDGVDGEEEEMVIPVAGSLVGLEAFCSMAQRRAAMRSKE